MPVVGSLAALLVVSAPALAGSCPPPSRCTAGNEITISVNGLDGHNLLEITDRAGGPDGKVTICHTGQNHEGDFIVRFL
jgi:hypothetical protein